MNKKNTSVVLFSTLYFLLSTCSLCAAGKSAKPEKLDPVNENFVVWTGVTPKNYIMGRYVVPSDLRQKVTIVLEFQMEKIGEQMPKFLSTFSALSHYGNAVGGETTDWMRADVHTKAIMVLSNRGQVFKDGPTQWKEGVKKLPEKTQPPQLGAVPVYNNITFDGAPDAGGKYPFIYIMPIEGKEPVYKSSLADFKMADARKAIAKALEEVSDFKPFFGVVSEPQFNKTLAPAVAKGKPIAPVTKGILAKVKTANPEEAKEAQRLYDGIEQTRSDLIMKIALEAGHAPHCAIADANFLAKYWPASKKEIAGVLGKINQNANLATLGDMYTKMRAWSDPNLKLKKSQIKDIGNKLKKFKKNLAPLKESKEITTQNCALLLDVEVDTMISDFEARAQQ